MEKMVCLLTLMFAVTGLLIGLPSQIKENRIKKQCGLSFLMVLLPLCVYLSTRILYMAVLKSWYIWIPDSLCIFLSAVLLYQFFKYKKRLVITTDWESIARVERATRKLIGKIIRIIANCLYRVECEKCKSYDIELKTFTVVDPTKLGKNVYVAEGYSMAAQCGLKSAEGNYKYYSSGNIMQARDETYLCHKCGHTFEIRRERVIACEL